MKILLGGIPLGCDNIGDEAILASVVGIFRAVDSRIEIEICTGDPLGTGRKFGVKTHPLYGFDPKIPVSGFSEALHGVDFYVWAGATGLSDYPDMAVSLLKIAQKQGVKTIVWNVGMNNTFNAVFYKIHGKKKKLAEFLQKVSGVQVEEKWNDFLVRAVRKRIGRTLSLCDLVILRDCQSLVELRKCGAFPDAGFGADSALLQKECTWAELPWTDEERTVFEAAEERIGLCISEQNALKNQGDFLQWLDRIHRMHPALLTVGLPMNPKKDYELMRKMRLKLEHPERFLLLHFPEPEQVQAVAGRCSVIVSSRLHLLILGLNRLVPGVGILRGSKIDFFLSRFGLKTAGSTENLNLSSLTEAVETALCRKDEFQQQANAVRTMLLSDLDHAIDRLKQTLSASK